MTQLESFAKELEKEAITTRKFMALVPTDHFAWVPHEKSMPMKALAVHVAELPTWIGMILQTSELDFATSPYQPKNIQTTEELLAHFEESLADGRAQIPLGKEESLNESWTLRQGETIFSTGSKWEVIRQTLSQIIHHRAQLGVYLRLLNIPIPGSYGPSADDHSF